MSLDADVQQYHARRFDERVGVLVQSLRGMADDVERRGAASPTLREPNDPDYVRAATTVIHTVTWGLANLNLDGLIEDAAKANGAR